MFLYLSISISVLFQAAFGAILLWSGYYFWFVCLFMVAANTLVISVVAASVFVEDFLEGLFS